MLLGLGLSPSMFSRKLTTFCEKVVDVLDAPTYKYRAYVKAKETHILGRLLNNRFTIDTLIIGNFNGYNTYQWEINILEIRGR